MKYSQMKKLIKEEVQRLQKLANITPPNNKAPLNEGIVCDSRRKACCFKCSKSISPGTVGAGCKISSANCSCTCISRSMVAPGSTIREQMDRIREENGMSNFGTLNETLTMMAAANACLDMVNNYEGEGECTCSATYNGPDDWSATGGGDCAGQVITPGSEGPRQYVRR